MITNEELRISNESYTNKDFLSIYPELLNLIKKISPKWDPSLSNESDPGNVLLKAMAFLADKVNYNTDKDVLENFLPSVTQETSARNLFEMNGYFPKYYQSAVTQVKFKYNGSKLSTGESFTFPAMETVLTDDDNNVSYSLLQPLTINKAKVATDAVPAIQGTFRTLSVGDSDVIKLSNLDDNNRVYFPETMIAQNGVFVFNVDSYQEGLTPAEDSWQRVDNLNLVEPGAGPYFKFGYDSNKRLPYVEFQDNIPDLIGDGLVIKYVITAGADGNISAQYLTKIVSPLNIEINAEKSLNFEKIDESSTEETDADDLIVYNVSSTINGADPETIDDAYNSYKKTVGTFTTLTTCRDYSNAIYNIVDVDTNYPFVSNVQVADRRNDINYGNSIVTYSSLGKEVIIETNDNEITPFTLCLYPLNPVYNIYDNKTYINSFKPLSKDNLKYIKSAIEDLKTISHTYQTLKNDDIYVIKNYYKLTIRLTTTYKVNNAEQYDIKENVRKALYKNFNARKVDYGYEIPFDTIYEVIKNSDARIKNVSMDDPDIDTRLCFANGTEESLFEKDTNGGVSIRRNYIYVLAKNILAGRLPLFDYDTDFMYDFGQSDVNTTILDVPSKIERLKSVTTKVEVPLAGHVTDDTFQYDLKDDEIIQCIAPSLQTAFTYPAYVNFRWASDNVIPANTEHRMGAGETLYINYTDSNKNVQNIIYTATSITRNGKVEMKDFVFIKTNFEMHRTADSYVAGDRSILEKEINGVTMTFNTLATDEQIEEREIVSRVIDDSELYCYWSTNRAGNKLFTEADAVRATPLGPVLYYETLLGDNEYFAYCDSGITEVVIRGSGTKLRWMSSSIGETEWACEKQSIDGLVNDGISAFNDFNWQVKSFKNKHMEIHAMQILTLAGGDSIKIGNISASTISDNKFDNTWKTISINSPIEYNILEGGYEPLDGFSDAALAWKLRTRLDINCGPALGQQVRENQSFVFTSVDAEDEEVLHTYEVKAYTDGGNLVEPYFAISQNVSVSGGKDVDLSVTEITISGVSEPKCILSANVFLYTVPTYMKQVSGDPIETELVKTKGYYSIDCTKLAYTNDMARIELPILRPINDSKMLIMFYVNKDTGAEYNITVSAGSSAVKRFNKDNNFLGEVAIAEIADGEKLTVVEFAPTHDGKLVIEVSYEGSSEKKPECSLVIGSISICKTEDGIWVNPQYELNADEQDRLATAIRKDKFYYNAPLDNGSAIDIDTPLKPEFFWDRNNLFNKFTLGEIDFTDETGSEITIVKSSQV